MAPVPAPLDVFSAGEIARAAGVDLAQARALLDSGTVTVLTGGYVGAQDAVAAVRLLRGDPGVVPGDRRLFAPLAASRRNAGFPLAASGAVHAVALVGLALVTTFELSGRAAPVRTQVEQPRLVFLAMPGPGGGGGGGGLKQPAPPARARMQGSSRLRSPVPVQRTVRSEKPQAEVRQAAPPPPPRPVERPVEPPPPIPTPEPVPPVVAPVVSAPADTHDQPGVLAENAPDSTSRGPGSGGGSGTGNGSGIGEGTGAGIGPGSGGGTGGGPYRPGSGITPPGLLHEVKPNYTEEARRRSLEGEVLLEIVVRADGNVGSVRLMRGLGSGLDQRAIDAVRQWRFSPARRHGTPVDVMVEVAVEFRLR